MKYTFVSKKNYCLFPFTIFLFLLAEALNILYFRALSGYDDLLEGKHDIFQGDGQTYWGILGLLLVLFFISLVFKYFLLTLVYLNSN